MQRLLAADISGFHKAHELSNYALGGARAALGTVRAAPGQGRRRIM